MRTRRIAAQTRFKEIPEPSNLQALFGRRPIRGYRKERIIEAQGPYGNSKRLSLSDVLQPNGLIPAPAAEGVCAGIPVFQQASAPGSAFCVPGATDGEHALRRVRGGAVRRADERNEVYSTHAHLLRARNKLFEQNTNDVTTCPTGCKPFLLTAANNTFSYSWVDGTTHLVRIPPGPYFVSGLNDAIVAAQLANKHYLVRTTTGSFFTAISIAQMPDSADISITCALIGPATFPSSDFAPPVGAAWAVPPEGIVPVVGILGDGGFGGVVGFAPGLYPDVAIAQDGGDFFQPAAGSPAFGAAQVFVSAARPLMPAQYRPGPPYSHRNPQFAQDTAVSSGHRLFRLRYDTVTTTAGTMRDPFGDATASAMAYSTHSGAPRTVKENHSRPCRPCRAAGPEP